MLFTLKTFQTLINHNLDYINHNPNFYENNCKGSLINIKPLPLPKFNEHPLDHFNSCRIALSSVTKPHFLFIKSQAFLVKKSSKRLIASNVMNYYYRIILSALTRFPARDHFSFHLQLWCIKLKKQSMAGTNTVASLHDVLGCYFYVTASHHHRNHHQKAKINRTLLLEQQKCAKMIFNKKRKRWPRNLWRGIFSTKVFFRCFYFSIMCFLLAIFLTLSSLGDCIVYNERNETTFFGGSA